MARDEDPSSPPFWWGKVTLKSDGASSDNLLGLMQRYYGFDVRGSFPHAIECPAVSLEGDPTNVAGGPVRTKLFFDRDSDDDTDEDSYAELYFNFDLSRRRVALNEKDPDYREPLVKWLSGELRAA